MSTALIINLIIWLIIAGFIYLAAQKIVALLPIDAWFKQIIGVILWILVAAIVLFKVPQANLMSASFANYLAAKGEAFPTVSHQVPFPVGGGKHGIMPNLEQYQKMMLPGGTGVTPANPKRYNFSANILGEAQAGTIDEQMSKLFDPKMSQPEHYGPYQQALNDLAQANGVDPRYFQEVAWAGAKAMKEGYKAKPLIQTYNEAIERTSRITGVSPAEVVRRGIVRAEMPIYGTAGVIGAQQVIQSQSPGPSDAAAAALGAGAM